MFYTMHHLFLTRYGTYLLVFDMRELFKDEKTALRYMSFWLHSVKLHAPDAPVLLVGTFLEDVNSSEKLGKVEKMLRSRFSHRFKQIVENNNNQYIYYPLDNKSSAGVNLVREMIEVVTREQDYIKRAVSLRWMCCLDKMLQSAPKAWMSLKEVKAHDIVSGTLL